MATIDKITLIEGTGDAQTTNTYDIVDSTAATAIEGLQTITTSLSNELTTVKNGVAGLDTSLEATITTVSGISTDLTDTKGTVQTLSTELTTVKNEVAGLDTSLDMSNTEVSNINSDLTALTNKVNAIPTVAIQYQDNTNTLAFRTNTVGGTPHTPVTPFADNSIEAISVDGSTYNISASSTGTVLKKYMKLLNKTITFPQGAIVGKMVIETLTNVPFAGNQIVSVWITSDTDLPVVLNWTIQLSGKMIIRIIPIGIGEDLPITLNPTLNVVYADSALPLTK